MKHTLIIFLIILINKTKCNVTANAKNVGEGGVSTTRLPSEFSGNKNLSDKKLESPINVGDGGSSVYLDDVIFAMKNQNWTAEEKPCLDHIYRLLAGLQNFTLWAVWEWDAQASEPQGLLFGNRYQLGNFDQCMKAPWSRTHPELKTKYCLAEIRLERTDKAVRRRVDRPTYPYQSALDYIEYHVPHSRPLNELTWGACVPSSCQPRTVERLLGIMLARSHLGAAGIKADISVDEPCQSAEDELEYDALFYAFLLVVALAVVIFYICAVHPYTGTGPLWNRAIAYDTTHCRKNWWLNLLMVNNYIDPENLCIIPSWYIPCDFHFFVVSILVYCIYRTWPKLGITIAGLFTVASIIVPGAVNYINELSAVQLFTFDFILNPRGSKDFKLTYIPSHTRFASYLVGFYTGYVFVKYSSKGNLDKMRQKWSVLGALAALTLMLLVMLLGSSYLWRSYHPLEGAVYAALNRPAWALGVGLLVLCCSLGHVPFIKAFLSWYPWVPLSRLSYGLFLTHAILIARNVFITRNPQHNDYFEILNETIGVIFFGCLAALVLFLLAEAPANKLMALCLKSKVKKMSDLESNPDPMSTTTSMSTVPTGSGYLSENLPGTIQYSSKI
ncbi:uncharacterized protein LOC111350683 isoform X2 [Spodoptera litura]|uniref:Uncharacterized protein LOC111350683 isoform X2 n=1 Tax=Spodoptera litura TaxID=69820 RepID=A0A9J7IKI1_SPOLT|nr:uncharacterized protein LOC111350683 isoform X2 [Spodoptera litura]